MKHILPVITLMLLALSLSGKGLTADTQRPSMQETLKAKADSGDARAMYRLSILYEDTDSLTAALDYLHRSAMAGFAPAMNYLGYCYGSGHLGLRQDSDSALWWIEQAASADEPDPKAFNNLGAMLLYGELGVKQDYAKAMYWLRRGADNGVPTSAAMLGKLYLEGLNSIPDTIAAMPYLRQAAKAGILDSALELADIVLPSTDTIPSEDLLNTALPYYYDRITPVAIPLIERAAEAQIPLAVAIMAQCYAEGIGVVYDYHKAIDLYAQAAELGEPHAQFILAETLQSLPDLLLSTHPDLPSTEELYRQAADQGITDASEALRPLRPHIGK
ncbi:MAG: sel1 repeat family protein [Muribaculaceae bacterium]|nr:sel1 repeat family protein [Muribaculaceae bacterium]